MNKLQMLLKIGFENSSNTERMYIAFEFTSEIHVCGT